MAVDYETDMTVELTNSISLRYNCFLQKHVESIAPTSLSANNHGHKQGVR